MRIRYPRSDGRLNRTRIPGFVDRSGTIRSLLASEEPSIQWLTRVRVLGESPNSPTSSRLRAAIRSSPRARALLAGRRELEGPAGARLVYSKWQGSHWVLAALAEIGYPPNDPDLEGLRDRVLDHWLDATFFLEFNARTAAESYRRPGVPCLQGRYRRCASTQGYALYALTELGLADDRADVLAERLLHWQWPDGGWNCDRNPDAATSSFYETLRPMLGLYAHGVARRAARARHAALRASELFLRRRLFRRLRDGSLMDPSFVQLHYPTYWHYDVLAGLEAMARLGRIRDSRCSAALDLLESKELPGGGWPAERKFYRVPDDGRGSGADYTTWGPTGVRTANEWVTVHALSVLSAAGRLNG